MWSYIRQKVTGRKDSPEKKSLIKGSKGPDKRVSENIATASASTKDETGENISSTTSQGTWNDNDSRSRNPVNDSKASVSCSPTIVNDDGKRAGKSTTSNSGSFCVGIVPSEPSFDAFSNANNVIPQLKDELGGVPSRINEIFNLKKKSKVSTSAIGVKQKVSIQLSSSDEDDIFFRSKIRSVPTEPEKKVTTNSTTTTRATAPDDCSNAKAPGGTNGDVPNNIADIANERLGTRDSSTQKKNAQEPSEKLKINTIPDDISEIGSIVSISQKERLALLAKPLTDLRKPLKEYMSQKIKNAASSPTMAEKSKACEAVSANKQSAKDKKTAGDDGGEDGGALPARRAADEAETKPILTKQAQLREILENIQSGKRVDGSLLPSTIARKGLERIKDRIQGSKTPQSGARSPNSGVSTPYRRGSSTPAFEKSQMNASFYDCGRTRSDGPHEMQNANGMAGDAMEANPNGKPDCFKRNDITQHLLSEFPIPQFRNMKSNVRNNMQPFGQSTSSSEVVGSNDVSGSDDVSAQSTTEESLLVHLGVGNFHRAHQAYYFQQLYDQNLRKNLGPIVGVSLRSQDVQTKLKKQNYDYTIIEDLAIGAEKEITSSAISIVAAGAGNTVRASAKTVTGATTAASNATTKSTVINILHSVLYNSCSAEDASQILGALTCPGTRIVSLTITEKGYCFDPVSRLLLKDHPDVKYDIARLKDVFSYYCSMAFGETASSASSEHNVPGSHSVDISQLGTLRRSTSRSPQKLANSGQPLSGSPSCLTADNNPGSPVDSRYFDVAAYCKMKRLNVVPKNALESLRELVHETAIMTPFNETTITSGPFLKTALGYLVLALFLRKQYKLRAFTVLSCDNVSGNGKLLQNLLLQMLDEMKDTTADEDAKTRLNHEFEKAFCTRRDPMDELMSHRFSDVGKFELAGGTRWKSEVTRLAVWLLRHCSFPCTMVDRLVPPPTEEQHRTWAQKLKAIGHVAWDYCPVFTESFTQWVIEDDFVAFTQPEFEKLQFPDNKKSIKIVKNVAPYEHIKLGFLNGAHSALAYIGFLSDKTLINDCMQDKLLVKFIERLWKWETHIGLLVGAVKDGNKDLKQLLLYDAFGMEEDIAIPAEVHEDKNDVKAETTSQKIGETGRNNEPQYGKKDEGVKTKDGNFDAVRTEEIPPDSKRSEADVKGIISAEEDSAKTAAKKLHSDFLVYLSGSKMSEQTRNFSVSSYCKELSDRFRNRAIKHPTKHIAMDGSQKLPQRVLYNVARPLLFSTKIPQTVKSGTKTADVAGSKLDILATKIDILDSEITMPDLIQSEIASGCPAPCVAFIIAAWLYYMQGEPHSEHNWTVQDPLKDTIQKLYHKVITRYTKKHWDCTITLESVPMLVQTLFEEVPTLFNAEMKKQKSLQKEIAIQLGNMISLGVYTALEFFLEKPHPLEEFAKSVAAKQDGKK